MKKVFICSPLRGDVEENQRKAKEYAHTATLEGYLPIVPHIYFTQFLDENNANERQMGINMGIELLKDCDLMWIFGEPTEGMKQEISIWEKLVASPFGKEPAIWK